MYHALFFNIHNLGLKRPPGPHRISTVLEEEGWDTEVVDFANYWTIEQLKEFAKSRITDSTVLVGYSIMFDTWDHPGVMPIFSQWLKDTYPNIYQVMGGQWPPVHKQTPNIDYFITGYGENALLALLKALVGNDNINDIKFDPMYLETGRKIISGNTFYPSFPMKSLMTRYHKNDFLKPYEWLTIEFSRGCKFKCPYCTFPILGVKGDYTRDSDDAYQALQETYDNFGIKNYFVADETFNDRPAKLKKFADVIEQLNFDPWFNGFIRADLLVSRGEQEWEQLARMGFMGQFYGIETTNPKSAKVIKKGMSPEKLLPGLLDAKKYFQSNHSKMYRGVIGLVVGLPYETPESMQSAFNWLENNWQGQGMTIYPLEIPVDSGKDVLSDLSINWKEYGYGEMTPEEITIATNSYVTQDIRIAIGLHESLLYWKNDHMNYLQAVQMADSWKSYTNEKEIFGVAGFSLDYLTSMGLSLDRALAVRKPSSKTGSDKMLMKFQRPIIDEYISNKLK